LSFSSTITASIVLIGMLVLIGSAAASLMAAFNGYFSAWTDISEAERARLDVGLQLSITNVGNRTVEATVRNRGSRTVFLTPGWNDAIVAYNTSRGWKPFLSSFTVVEIRVSGSDYSFQPSTHPYINPGEEAVIVIQLPDEAPDIPNGSLVVAVFASHYGVSAVGEAVKP
jgi:archaellum component FlaF (FlaF/FlaG flagellin family)